MKGREHSSTLNTPKITCFGDKYNLSSKLQFDISSIFNSYIKFYNFKLSKLSFI